jgi:hypothetical protein
MSAGKQFDKSDAISAGDTVYVARVDHACADVVLGRVYVYSPRPTPHNGTRCQRCGTPDIALPNEACHYVASTDRSLPQRWLKKIPPLAELESEKREEEITA